VTLLGSFAKTVFVLEASRRNAAIQR